MKMMLSALFILFFTRSVAISAEDEVGQLTMSDEARLLNRLLSKYEARGVDARPLLNSSEKVEVYFGMRLISMDMDEAKQTMKVSVWHRILWYDPYLAWNRTDYGNAYMVKIPTSKIWTPSISNVNTAVASVHTRTTGLNVKYNGRVFWTPHSEYTVGCIIDARDYPFDEHNCAMWFQQLADSSANFRLLAYPKSPLDLSTSLHEYSSSMAWKITGNTTDLVSKPSQQNVTLVYSNRPALRFTLSAKRRPTFQAYLLLVPCILMPLLGAIVFTLPPERPDRLSLTMSLFGAYVILLLLLTTNVPPTPASVPKLCIYYGVNLLMTPMCLMLTSIVINLTKRDDVTQPIPLWIRKVILNGAGRILLSSHKSAAEQNEKSCNVWPEPPEVPFSNLQRENLYESKYMYKHHGPEEQNNSEVLMKQFMEHIIRVREPQTQNQPRNQEWRRVAAVCDRIFLILFLLLGVICFIVWYPM